MIIQHFENEKWRCDAHCLPVGMKCNNSMETECLVLRLSSEDVERCAVLFYGDFAQWRGLSNLGGWSLLAGLQHRPFRLCRGMDDSNRGCSTIEVPSGSSRYGRHPAEGAAVGLLFIGRLTCACAPSWGVLLIWKLLVRCLETKAGRSAVVAWKARVALEGWYTYRWCNDVHPVIGRLHSPSKAAQEQSPWSYDIYSSYAFCFLR